MLTCEYTALELSVCMNYYDLTKDNDEVSKSL